MRRWRAPLILGGVFVALGLALVATLPLVVRHLAIRQLEGATGREVRLADVDLNLFTRRLVLKDVSVRPAADTPALLEVGRVEMRFRYLPLVRGRVHLDDLTLYNLSVHIVRDAGGTLSAGDVVERWLARRGEPLGATLAHLRIERGRITFVDHAAEPDHRWVLQDLALEAHDIVTVADAGAGRASATFVVGGAPGTLTLAEIRVRPLEVRAALEIEGLDVAPFGAYAGGGLRPVAGRLSTRLTVDYDARGFVRASGTGTLRDLAVARSAETAAFLSAPTVEVSTRDVSFVGGRPAAGHVRLSAPRVTFFDATAPRARPLDLTGFSLVFEGARVSAPWPGSIALDAELPGGGRLQARGQAGLFAPAADVTVEVSGLDVALAQVWIPPDAALEPAAGRVSAALALRYAAGGPLQVSGRAHVVDFELARRGGRLPLVQDDRVDITVGEARLGGGGLSLGRLDVIGSPTVVDESRTPPQRFHLPRVSLTFSGGGFPGGGPTHVAALASLPRGGALEAKGTAELARAAASLTVTTTGADLTLARAYLPGNGPFDLGGGRLDARLQIEWSGGIEADGRFTLRDLVVLRRGRAEPFIEHRALEGTLSDLVVSDGRFSLARLSLTGAPTITDASVTPPQRFQTRRLALTVTDFTWPGSRAAGLEGQTEIADGGGATLSGTIHPATLAADVRVVFDAVDVGRARGYAPAHVPLLVEGGRVGAIVRLRHTREAGVRLDATGTARDLALRFADGSPWRVRDDRVSFTVDGLVVKDGAVTVAEAAVESTPRLAHGDASAAIVPRVRAEVKGLAWPGRDPAHLTLAAEFPEAGRVEARGTFVPATRRVDLTIRAQDAPIAPLALVLPIDAPLAGRLDARVTATARPSAGAFTVRGELTLRDVGLGPGDVAPVRVERVQVDGLDLSEGGLGIARLTLLRPSVLIERARDRTFPLRALLTPDDRGAPGARPFHVDELVVEDGDARFVDRTTTPFYSEEVSRLTATVHGLTNADDRRATLKIQGLVGVDAALDLRGEVAPFARPFFLEVEGELRDFAVPRTNPYLRRVLDWIARRGRLTTQVRYRIVGGELSAVNELLVQRLDVERAGDEDRAERLVGLPLGLAVALLKDARGDIRFTLPVSGKLGSPTFSFGDAVGQALKNVLVRLVTAPFRAIGSVFRRDDAVTAVAIDPVTFDPGSAALTAGASAHLQRVADFLRASPYVQLTLRPVVTEADVRALRVREVTVRIQGVQRQQHLDDFGEAARRVWERTARGAAPPKDPQVIVRRLAEVEPVPAEAARRLAERRHRVTWTYLFEVAGIQRDRLLDHAGTAPTGATGPGRVAFSLEPAS